VSRKTEVQEVALAASAVAEPCAQHVVCRSKIGEMGADDLEIATRFRIALEAAAKSGDREALYPFLAADVEWVTAKRTLHGIDEVREELIWASPDENFDLEFEEGEWVELGDGRLVLDVHQVYRVKATPAADRTDDSRQPDQPL
jgi:hypothetical protein